MWSEEKIQEYIKKKLFPERFRHVLGVMESAEELSRLYGEDGRKARLAALVHDCAKHMSNEEILNLVKSQGYEIDEICARNPQLMHGLAGAIIGEEVMGIKDKEIFNAVRYHTTGRKDMSLLEKIIYVADYIEPSRDFPGVENLRKAAGEGIDKAVLMALDNTIKYVISRGELLYMDTVDARNYLLCRE